MSSHPSKGLLPREKVFVEQYIKNNHPVKAAIMAGYSDKAARNTSYVLLRRPRVMAAIQKIKDIRFSSITVENAYEKDEIIRGLFEIATNTANSASSRVSAYATLAKYTIEAKNQGTNKLNFTLNIGDTNLLQTAAEPNGIDTSAYDVGEENTEVLEDIN